MNSTPAFTLDFSDITLADVSLVGGKNASLGELFGSLKPQGVGVVDGFATTADAYRALLREADLETRLRALLTGLNPENLEDLARYGHAARAAVLDTPLPAPVRDAVLAAYECLCERIGYEPALAVRSSATAEDLPEASFAGAAETFLNVRGRDALLRAVHACCASLFTDRAISYRARLGYDHLKVALSVGVMPMVRSDLASSGVIFTLDTESGFRDAIVVSGAYGLGEYVVQGVVTPDEWTVFTPALAAGARPIIGRRLGSKEVRLVYADGTRATRSESTPAEGADALLSHRRRGADLARWAHLIERHYSSRAGHAQPMDIEWAKDGSSGGLFILQARPETVHSRKERQVAAEIYHLTPPAAAPIVTGQAVGERIAAGRARVVRDVAGLAEVQAGRSPRRRADRSRLGARDAPRSRRS